MTAAFFGAVIIANGFGRRFAGGLLGQWLGPIGGTQVARAAQAAIAGASVAALAWLGNAPPVSAGLPWWAPLLAAAATFAGATWGFPTYSLRWPFINLRASHMVARTLGDTIGLSINGAIACAPLALVAWGAGLPAWPLVLAGLARGPLWWAAAAWVPDARWLGYWWFAPDQGRWIPMPTAVAEFYAGCWIGIGLILTISIGA